MVQSLRIRPASFALALLLLVSAGGCASSGTKTEPYPGTDPDKPLPLGVYISRLHGLLFNWGKVKAEFLETTGNMARLNAIELALSKLVKARFPELKRELELSNVEHNRVVLAAALGFLREPEALNPLLNALNDACPDVQANALIGLAVLADPNTPVDFVAQRLDSDDPPGAAANASFCIMRLTLAGANVTRALPAVRRGLMSKDPIVRLHCTWIVGEVRDQSSSPQLLALLNDDKPAVVAAAAEGLGKLREMRAVTPLIDALSSKSLLVRDKARASLQKLNNGEDLGMEPGPWIRWKKEQHLDETGDAAASRPTSLPATAPSTLPSTGTAKDK